MSFHTSGAAAELTERKKERRGRRLVFTTVTMGTVTQKSLLLYTENTWCKYKLEPFAFLKGSASRILVVLSRMSGKEAF